MQQQVYEMLAQLADLADMEVSLEIKMFSDGSLRGNVVYDDSHETVELEDGTVLLVFANSMDGIFSNLINLYYTN